MNKFTNLHQHSMYSLLDGMSKPEDMIQKAKKLNYSALCITDHGVLFNAPEVYLACKDEGIDYIYGCELYICDDRFVKDNDNRYSHLVVLAHNEEGRINLNKIISDSYENGFYYKPRTDFGFLQAHSAGLVVLSACMAGEVSRALESGSIELAEGIVLKYKAVFGDNYYLEAQSHDIPEQHVLNRAIIDLAIKTNTKYVITTDAHYVNKDDSYIHSQFVQTAKDNDDGGIYKDCYMQGYDDIVNICSVSLSKTEIDTACETIEEIVKKCINIKLPIAEAEIPRPKLPDGFTEEIDYLRDMVYKSFYEKGIDKYPNSQEYIDRIEYELDALHKMNYDRYLLNIIEQFEDFNKLGAGRGCFTEEAMVTTDKGIKKIKDVVIGDRVISADNRLNEVEKTFSYDVFNEDMIEFEYMTQGTVKGWNRNMCTIDHKILVNRNGLIKYVKAEDLKESDFLCSPLLKTDAKKIIFDLNDYNYRCFDYDDEYIYEEVGTNKAYLYSPKNLEKTGIVTSSFAKKIINNPDLNHPQAQKNINKLMNYVPFSSVKEYSDYCKKNSKKRIRKVRRFIELDEKFNLFIGLLYGDGFNRAPSEVCLAINKTSKYEENRNVFYEIAEHIGLETFEKPTKDKNLIQLYMRGISFYNFIAKEFFVSKKGVEKQFNPILFNQDIKNIKALKRGLMISDGSVNFETRKINFDNNSKSIISAFKIIDSILGEQPKRITIREKWIDKRGYHCREGYKLQAYKRKTNNTKMFKDDNYWYLPVTSIKRHKNYNGKVYDLKIKNDPSYTINNIIVHNSSSGSCVCWLSGITKVDPIKYNCVFERFIDVGQLKQLEAGEITKDKLKTPDIDSDVATSIRHDVINNLTTKYGSDRVCAIGTIGLSWAKSAIKDVARIVGIEASVANDITKTIISKELTPEVIRDEIKSEYKERYPKMFEIAERITGVARTFGVHASGKIVSDKDLTYYAPTAILNGEKTIMCDMHSVDLLMLLKSDVLGLRTLDVIYDVLEMIDKNYDYVDPNIINLNDANVYNFFQRGETDNVFQFSSDFMRSILKEMKPNNIEDLTAANAMGRPGPMQNIPHYIDRKHGREDVTYLHNDLKDILSETYGIMCYQEQVIALGRYAGLKNPDDLRVATAKKKPAMLEKVKPELINGLMKHRWTIEQIETLWSELLAYAQYSFNRSHAISYSLTAYQTMFLRCYHPLEFWAASLNSVEGKSEDITQFISSMKKDNIKLIIPSYKDISSKCHVKNDTVVIGTNIIKGMSSRIAEDMFWAKKIDVRKDNFIDFLIYNEEGFNDKEHVKIGKKSLETLIKLGYFDCSGSRAELLDLLDVFNNGKGIKYDAKHKPATKEKRAIELNKYAKEQQPIKPRASEVLMWEQECFGIPLSSFSGVPRDLGYIYNIDKNIYSEKTVYKISVYGIASGNTHMVQYSKHNSLAVGDIIRLNKVVTKSYKTGKMYKTPILYAYDLVQKSS